MNRHRQFIPCPVKGPKCTGVIKTIGAKSCHPCGRMAAYKPVRPCPVGAPGCAGVISTPAAASCHPCYVATRKGHAAPASEAESFRVKGDTARLHKRSPVYVRSLEQLVEVCNIDLSVWVVDEWECKASQQTSVPRATRAAEDGKWVRPSTEPVCVQMFHVSAVLKRKTSTILTMEAVAAGLLEDIRAELRRKSVPRTPRRFVDNGWLFEFSPFDLHMGKYAWGEESVTNYDVDMAEDLFNASLDFLLEKALRLAGGRLARVLCVFGNDVAHIDSKRGQTTAGTPMDVDTRYVRVYRRICAVHRRAVDLLSEVAPVDVKIVPGNHDELTAFHLGEILATRYEGSRRVTVDNSPRLTKYYEYGTNLFGFTHGDALRISELPLLMARENKAAWSRCDSREWHVGHKHIKEDIEWYPDEPRMRRSKAGRARQTTHSDKGVRVRRLSSLSAHDAWHTHHGYTDRRACDAFVYHKTAGYMANLSFNVDHFSGKALHLPAPRGRRRAA